MPRVVALLLRGSVHSTMDKRADAIQRYHFSVDDVFDALLEVSDQRMPLFAHPFFQALAHVHDVFGTHVHLYLFYQKRLSMTTRSLAEVSGTLQEDFRDTDWLHLGPHALDNETPPYAQTPVQQMATFEAIYAEIARFTGRPTTSRWVRLHYFSEAYELAAYFRAKGVEALLSTDKAAISYRLPPDVQARLRDTGTADYQGMTFVRSHWRIETLVQHGFTAPRVYHELAAILARQRYVVILTHEYELVRPDVRAMTTTVLQALQQQGAHSL